MSTIPRVRVTARPNRSFRGALLLTFAEPCPWCGRLHTHGSSAGLDADGTYGHRTDHCHDHTHAMRPDGKRARVTAANVCPNDHPGVILVPAETDA
jgi:hypothetical protein